MARVGQGGRERRASQGRSNGLRVIAGTLKGRRLKTPRWEGLRPTSDRLRETLFNVLAPRISGARVLDGYAGTGALGIEAISRGAGRVTFVERDRRARALIADNLAVCGVENSRAIICAGFNRLARRVDDTAAGASEPGGPVPNQSVTDTSHYDNTYDVVLLDPPYDEPPERVVASAAPLVASGGLLVLEHAKRAAAPAWVAGLTRMRQIASGDSMLSFYAWPH